MAAKPVQITCDKCGAVFFTDIHELAEIICPKSNNLIIRSVSGICGVCKERYYFAISDKILERIMKEKADIKS